VSDLSIARLLVAPVAIVAAASPAAATDYLSVSEAQRALFPQAKAFAAQPVALSKDQIKRIGKLGGTPQRTAEPKVWRASATDGKFQGWMIVDEVIGKHEYITYATAISPEGKVLGVEIMSYRESKGGEVRNERWRDKFRGKTLADPFKLQKDIPNISGATLSCRNITDGVKRLLALREVALVDTR
jgi:hypothetical protein